MEANIEFWKVSCDAFFKCVFEAFFIMIFWCFLDLNLDLCAQSQCFVRIFPKSTFSEKLQKVWILDFFGEVKAKKNRENIVLKSIIFSNIDFHAFFDRL